MARVHLLTVKPESDYRARGGYRALKENAELDRFKVHQLEEDPKAADLILFVEVDTGRLCEDVLKHPLIKRYRGKCFMHSTDWRVIPFVPGIYTSLEKSWYLPGRSRPGFYLSCLMNPLVKSEPGKDCDLLYTFMGDTQTHPVRKVLADLRHPRGEFVDTAVDNHSVTWQGSPEEKQAFWSRYVDLAKRGKYILCPRGLAPSSIRLFEAMCMGRVPVILADEWMPPAGPDWEKFSLRIPEKDAFRVADIMQRVEPRAEQMGRIARAEWEKHFGLDVIFHKVVELCLEIRASRRLPEPLSRLSIIPQLLRPKNLREWRRQVSQRLNGS